MATPTKRPKWIIDGSLGQDPVQVVTAAELDAHKLMSRWRGDFPTCDVNQVRKDVKSVLELVARIMENEIADTNATIYDLDGNPVKPIVNPPIERTESVCCNCGGPARNVSEHHKYCDECGCSDG